MSNVWVEGEVSAGYESVRTLFEENLRRFREEHAQLCVYVKGRCVVDVWGSTQASAAFGPDAIVNIFSSGKSLESIAVAWLVGQGRLRYSDPIALHWPEFAQHEKSAITIADLMRHEAGLASFSVSMDPASLMLDRLKSNEAGRVVESEALNFNRSPYDPRDYHAITRGWIVNEVFRRADSAGRTLGEYLRDEISNPLSIDAYIGVPQASLSQRAPVRPLSILYQFFAGLRPKALGRRVMQSTATLLGRLWKMRSLIGAKHPEGALRPFKGKSAVAAFNDDDIAMGESSSANAHCSARALAKLAAAMAAGGAIDGVELLPNAAWQQMHGAVMARRMGGLFNSHFTQGGVAHFVFDAENPAWLDEELNQGREGFYGWMGLGGSIFQWHPELDVGFAFVPTALHSLDFCNERGKLLQQEVLACIR